MGASGSGKSHLQETVAELIPEEDRMSITDLSESSFYYFKSGELSHKLILIEDLDGAESALYPLRELQSKKTITKTFVEKTRQGMKTTSRTVNGPVCVAGCTTKERVYEDNSNRSFLIYIDSSTDQDEKIMHYQRALSAGITNEQERTDAANLLKNSQRILKPYRVVNPFANQLLLPKSVFKPRRTNAHYLHFIEAVTFLHQAQRVLHVNNETGEEFIETTLEDIEAANYLLKDILLKKSDRLTPACRAYFEELKTYLQREKITDFKNIDVRIALGLSHSQQKRYMSQLLNDFYIQIKSGNHKTGLVYEITSFEEYKHLKNQVNTVLDKVLKNIAPKIKKQVVREPLK
jgi:energy-coupling factor transporter ATP-binding protein EcfA2